MSQAWSWVLGLGSWVLGLLGRSPGILRRLIVDNPVGLFYPLFLTCLITDIHTDITDASSSDKVQSPLSNSCDDIRNMAKFREQNTRRFVRQGIGYHHLVMFEQGHNSYHNS